MGRNAPYWEKHRAIIRQMFAPAFRAYSGDAGLSLPAEVLIVAGGKPS